MEILELEQKYSELKSSLSELNSKRSKLLLIANYFSFVLPNDNVNILEAYIVEFIFDYLSYIESLQIRGLSPEVLSKLQLQLKILLELNFAYVNKDDISRSSLTLDEKLKVMDKWLNDEPSNQTESKIYFPVLEKNEGGFGNGYLESLNVEIKNGEQKFYIAPSEYENDEQLEKQITLCFTTALNYCKKFIRKIKPTHTIYLHFEGKLGMYSGNSLGIALTLIFIEAILKYYNSTIVLNVNNRIAVTGGVDQNSKIISTSKAIIEMKVETVFFSDAQIFCVPKVDEIWAEEKLKELKTIYPNRELKIIGLTDLNDLLDRRQIVDIRKQKLIVRGGKSIKKNWIGAAATVLLAILFAYLFAMDWDDNPAILSVDGNTLFVKNKNGKVLWERTLILGKYEFSETELKSIARIIDINEDGENEILITKRYDDKGLFIKDYSSVYCYNNKGKVIWSSEFKDVVISKREDPGNDYEVRMVDTLTLYSEKCLMVISTSITSFPSALFRIKLKTGERLPGAFWAAGHILEGEVMDLDNDRKKEFIGIGYENGYEDVTFFGFEIDSLLKMRPTTDEYLLRNMSTADMKVYIRFPKIDYDYYKQIRTPSLISASFSDNQSRSEYRFSVGENSQVQIANISYKIKYNLKDIEIIINSGFRVKRDTLVAQGILKLPYTDTEAYKNIIKNNILYWKNGKWVKRNELD